jgi:hypothetical protein
VADASPQLTPPEPRPLLAFGPTESIAIPRRAPDAPKPPFRPVRRPLTDRQGRRLAPQFAALQETLAQHEAATLTDATEASDPEHIVVFEVVGTVAGFVRATEGIDGLNFVADLVGDGYEPDDDFHYIKEGEVEDDKVPQTLYLVMANSKAITELIRLFKLYQEHDGDITFDTGLNPLKDVFKLLHTIRRWGPIDRVEETGLLEQWRESVAVRGQSGIERVEIELVWASTPEARQATQLRVEAVVAQTPNAQVLSAASIPAIQYHALLVELPPTQVDQILREGPEAVELLATEDVLFLAPATAMTLEAAPADLASIVTDGPLPTGDPQVALFDGMPLENHSVLAGRLTVHDPEERGTKYAPQQCVHGTAMASLIIHGDLNDPQPPLTTPLYVEPILEPHEYYCRTEVMPPGALFVDILHAAVQRLLGGTSPTAPTVKLINLSIGDPARAFTRRMSPLARLLDYLTVTHNVLFSVSAGNHPARRGDQPGPHLAATPSVLDDPTKLDAELRRTLRDQSRQRGLLAPAETINNLTVGATSDDHSDVELPDNIIEPVKRGAIAPYSPSGFGFRRSPKPDLHLPGGRLAVTRPATTEGQPTATLEAAATGPRGPGLLVAAPTAAQGSSGMLHSYGTSNAAALATHHCARVLDTLVQLQADQDEWDYPDSQFHPVLIKTLLVHATSWPNAAEGWAVDLGAVATRRRRALTQHLGFGVLDTDRLATATTRRATVIGAGELKNNKRRSFRFPLPPSLSSHVGWRRLTVTLAWFSPVAPRTQQYRIAHLQFGSPREQLRVTPTEVDHNANGNGTVLHEVLEGTRAAGYTADDVLAIDVDCRVRVGRLYVPVVFGIAATLEVGQDVQIDVHQEVHNRLRAQVSAGRVRPTARG